MAGHCRPLPLPEIPKHRQASLNQSLVGSLVLSPGSWCTQDFVVPSKSLCFPSPVEVVIKSHWPAKSNSLRVPVPLPYPFVGKSVVGPELSQQCKHFFGIIVLQFVGRLLGGSMGLMVTSSNKTYTTRRASQDCYSQSPCPCAGHRRPMPPQK